MNAFDKIIDTLGGSAVRAGNSVNYKCPSHDDRRASLSINQSDDGKILLYCHAG